MIGDFNAIIDSHEKFSICPTNKTSTYRLIHIDANVSYTLTNVRKYDDYSSIMLDKIICNQN